MIFKQWQQVLDGTRTQTRRIENEDDYGWTTGNMHKINPRTGTEYLAYSTVHSANHRVRFGVGRLLPVIPKRGQKAIRDDAGNIRRVCITAIHRERLHDITEADAKAEGVNSVEEYRALWNSINTKKGIRWEDNPSVWVIQFEVVKP